MREPLLKIKPNPGVNSAESLIAGEDYYWEDGLLVMTAAYHQRRGSCCGSGCRWCPFEPSHELGATRLAIDSLRRDL